MVISANLSGAKISRSHRDRPALSAQTDLQLRIKLWSTFNALSPAVATAFEQITCPIPTPQAVHYQ